MTASPGRGPACRRGYTTSSSDEPHAWPVTNERRGRTHNETSGSQAPTASRVPQVPPCATSSRSASSWPATGRLARLDVGQPRVPSDPSAEAAPHLRRAVTIMSLDALMLSQWQTAFLLARGLANGNEKTWKSGLSTWSRKPFGAQVSRGFKSLPLRLNERLPGQGAAPVGRLAVFEPQHQSRDVHGRRQASIGLRRHWRKTGARLANSTTLRRHCGVCSWRRNRVVSACIERSGRGERGWP